MSTSLEILSGGHSHQGRKPLNQDFYNLSLPQEPQRTTKGIALALADGISSSAVSQEASQTAVNSFLQDYLSTPETWSVKKSAHRVAEAINAWLYAQNRRNHLHVDIDRGYVCTFSALILRSSTAYMVHVGDTRILRVREGVVAQLTQDHRIAISSEQSYLARALGMDSEVRIDFERHALHVGDVFLLATDGVYEFVSTQAILEAASHEDPSVAAHALVQQAFDNGSDDNLTVQIVRITALPDKNVHELHSQLKTLPFAPVLEPRMLFDGYEIIRALSSTYRSHVYLARDQETQSAVVIKVPSVDQREEKGYIERLMMEEWIARRINNAHVMKSYLATRGRNYLYTVTEYIEGQTLWQWRIDHPKPSLETVRDMADQIARGLLAFHRQEIVHQDLRPQNIMIDATGTLKIIDFGSARVEGISEMNTLLDEGILGTAQYAAPEYFLGEVGTYKSDIYSFAAIIYELLSGRLPYGAHVARSTTPAAQKKLKYTSIQREDVAIPLWIDAALKRALHPNPNERYETLSEFVYDLRHPNRAFLNKTRPPLIERDPVLFWKGLSFMLMGVIVFLLSQS